MKAPLLATIDIGSNSILLLVGRIVNGQFQMELQRKETIRLGGALDAQGNLEANAMQRGWECLQRFADLISHVKVIHRRAVATQTLREAHNRDIFLAQASHIVGCTVEVISGESEAALIYQGVSSMLPDDTRSRLVVDIGGRSTEVCIGQGIQLQIATSCPLGSVAWAQRFFSDGSLCAAHFAEAETAAEHVFQQYLSPVMEQTWQQALGASGTAGAISKVLHQLGQPASEISRQGLFQLKARLIQAGHINNLPLQGLREELRPVIGGGVSIMCAVFNLLQLEHMRIAQGALRHGVMFAMHQALQK